MCKDDLSRSRGYKLCKHWATTKLRITLSQYEWDRLPSSHVVVEKPTAVQLACT